MILDPVSLGAVIEIEGFSLEIIKNRKSSLVNFVTFNLTHNISLNWNVFEDIVVFQEYYFKIFLGKAYFVPFK